MSIIPAARVRRLVERVLLFLAIASAAGSLCCGSRVTAFDYPTVPGINDSSLSESLRARYRVDAARLSLRFRAEPAYNFDDLPVEVEPHLCETIYRVIVRVRLLAAGAEHDTVFSTYRIHTWCSPNVMKGFCSPDTSREEIRRWADGEHPCGQAQLDSLYASAGLRVVENHTVMGSRLVIFTTDRPVNIERLCRVLDAIPGLRGASPNRRIGDGNDIHLRVTDGAWEVGFEAAWGDCPAGCTRHRTWWFRIAGGAAPQFLGAEGSPVEPIEGGDPGPFPYDSDCELGHSPPSSEF